jgi:RNAse (barnase) inhibitor barstar
VSSRLAPLLNGSFPPGRYRLTGPVSLREAYDGIGAAGWSAGVIHGREIDGRTDMFEQFATAHKFPDWFGGNWDAFVDCLRDLSWLPGDGVAVLWQHYAMFAAALPELAERVDEILDDVIVQRTEIDVPPLFVLYPGPRDGASGSRAWQLHPAS